MYKLYDFLESGNGYKVRLLMHILNIPYQLIEKDILAGETRTDDFLKINPNGKIPALEIGDGKCLTESNAILTFLARGSEFFPDEPWLNAKIVSWLFFEQYSHEPNVAVARFWSHFVEMTDEKKVQIKEKHRDGYKALDVMERALANNPAGWLEGQHMSIADISLYAYTHVASEGGFDLGGYPKINKWIRRISDHPNYVEITHRHITK